MQLQLLFVSSAKAWFEPETFSNELQLDLVLEVIYGIVHQMPWRLLGKVELVKNLGYKDSCEAYTDTYWDVDLKSVL